MLLVRLGNHCHINNPYLPSLAASWGKDFRTGLCTETLPKPRGASRGTGAAAGNEHTETWASGLSVCPGVPVCPRGGGRTGLLPGMCLSGQHIPCWCLFSPALGWWELQPWAVMAIRAGGWNPPAGACDTSWLLKFPVYLFYFNLRHTAVAVWALMRLLSPGIAGCADERRNPWQSPQSHPAK